MFLPDAEPGIEIDIEKFREWEKDKPHYEIGEYFNTLMVTLSDGDYSVAKSCPFVHRIIHRTRGGNQE